MKKIDEMNKSEVLNTLNKISKIQYKLLKKLAHESKEDKYEMMHGEIFSYERRLNDARNKLEEAILNNDKQSEEEARDQILYLEEQLRELKN